VVGVLCAVGWAYPGRASAQATTPIELKWNALESCPSAETVLARVYKIAGSSRAMPNTLRADATITQPSDGLFRLRLEIQYGDFSAVRNIEGKSCKDLAGATAVALALLLSSEEPLSERDLAGATPTTGEPTRGSNERDKPSAPPPAATPPPREASPPAPPPSTNPESPRQWRLLLLAPVGALGVGPLQQVSLGLGFAAGFSVDGWRFLAEGKFWAPQSETVANLGDYDVTFNRFTVGARACRDVFGSRFEVAPCVLMSVQHLTERGSGTNLVSNSDTATWAAVGIGAQARLRIAPWLGLVAGLDGEIQFARPEVSISLPVLTSPLPPGSPNQTILVERLRPVAATITIGSQWIF